LGETDLSQDVSGISPVMAGRGGCVGAPFCIKTERGDREVHVLVRTSNMDNWWNSLGVAQMTAVKYSLQTSVTEQNDSDSDSDRGGGYQVKLLSLIRSRRKIPINDHHNLRHITDPIPEFVRRDFRDKYCLDADFGCERRCGAEGVCCGGGMRKAPETLDETWRSRGLGDLNVCGCFLRHGCDRG